MVLKIKKINIYILLSLLTATFFRLYNLGYSDFQGDEIRALFLPVQGESFVNFLLRQRKGPIQFIISYLVSFFDPTYKYYFFDRLPFAVASIVSVYFLYKFIRGYFNENTAFIATLIVSINGFFVGLSRILQYQGFVFLSMSLTLYLLGLSVHNEKYKYTGLYFGTLVWGLGMLAHYDALFIAPFVMYQLFQWFKLYSDKASERLKHIVLALYIPFIMQILYYGALFLSVTLETRSYWLGRLTGTVSSKSPSSVYLFRVYQPFLAYEMYIVFFLISLIILLIFIFNIYRKKTVQKEFSNYAMLFVWSAFPLFFMEKLVKIPGTHIYTYLLPLIIIIAFTIDRCLTFLVRWPFAHRTFYIIIIIVFGFLSYQSYKVFLENNTEYPWESENILSLSMQIPEHDKYHLSLFGFPYNRSWQTIKNFTSLYPNIKIYSSNENNAISNYYLRMEKNTDKAGFYVYVRNPQSFKNSPNNEKYLYWSGNNAPIFTKSRGGQDIVRVYLMPVGTKDDLKLSGY